MVLFYRRVSQFYNDLWFFMMFHMFHVLCCFPTLDIASTIPDFLGCGILLPPSLSSCPCSIIHFTNLFQHNPRPLSDSMVLEVKIWHVCCDTKRYNIYHVPDHSWVDIVTFHRLWKVTPSPTEKWKLRFFSCPKVNKWTVLEPWTTPELKAKEVSNDAPNQPGKNPTDQATPSRCLLLLLCSCWHLKRAAVRPRCMFLASPLRIPECQKVAEFHLKNWVNREACPLCLHAHSPYVTCRAGHIPSSSPFCKSFSTVQQSAHGLKARMGPLDPTSRQCS